MRRVFLLIGLACILPACAQPPLLPPGPEAAIDRIWERIVERVKMMRAD